MRKNSGFTLMELMVGLAIIGVMTAIAVPNYLEWLPDNRLKDVARGIYGDMQLAKLNAIKEHKDWAIVFDPTNKKYYVCSDKGTATSWALSNITDKKIVPVKTVVFPNLSGIQFGKGSATKDATTATNGQSFGTNYITFTLDYATFNPLGLGKSGYVYVENIKRTTYAIGMESTGFIKIKKWAGSAWK